MFHLLDLDLNSGMVFGFKTGGLIFMTRFITLTLSFSSSTNDTSRFRFWSVLLLLVMVLCGLAFVGLSAASLFLETRWAPWLLWLAAGLDAYLLLRIHGWFHNSNRFDLMSQPKG